MSAGDLAGAEAHAARARGSRHRHRQPRGRLLGDDQARASWRRDAAISTPRVAPSPTDWASRSRSVCLRCSLMRSIALPEILEAQDEALCARRVLAYAADHPTATAQARDAIRRRLETLPAERMRCRIGPGWNSTICSIASSSKATLRMHR